MRSLIALVAVVALKGPLEAQIPAAAGDTTVSAVVHAFHAALAAGDSAAALARLRPDVVIFESGHAETLSEYRSGHLSSDIAFASATRHEPVNESVSVSGDQALYMAETRTRGRWRDRDIDSRGTETMVLVRTPDGWRIRHIHWSSR